MLPSEYINSISEFVSDFDYEIVNSDEKRIRIILDHLSGIQFELFFDEDESITFYFYQRTQSFIFNGERTDLNDIISVVFAAFFKLYKKQASLCLINFPHPALPELDETEIYARYITPGQIRSTILDFSLDGLEEIKDLLASVYLWKFMFWRSVGCPCDKCKKELNPPFDHNNEINPDFKRRIINILGKKELYNQHTRYLPNWIYYKDFADGVSVVFSPDLCELLRHLNETDDVELNTLEGVNADVEFNLHIRNIIPHAEKSLISNILSSLEDELSADPFFIPLENIIIGIGKESIIFKESICGEYAFKLEKEKIRERNSHENKLLFPVNKFEWSSKIDPDLFECMIKDLLERESNTLRVRKVAPLNQPDNGRDLLMLITDPSIRNQVAGESPYFEKKVIVQCKAYSKSVGKSDVKDIRDTIEYYDYDGYFLAVSSQITTPLTDHLDRLKNKGYWIDWWNRDDIEHRLSANKDILMKYSQIIKDINQT